MQFHQVLGQDALKKQLFAELQTGRIPHARLFSGPEGSGQLALALAYARLVLSLNWQPHSDAWQACQHKVDKLAHPDLHFIYPVVSGEGAKTKPKSADYLEAWREFVRKSPYGNLFDWLQHIEAGNKQGIIRVEDAQEILRTISLKSYEGGYKVVVIWMPESMNIEAGNKILKILEEPPQKTLFLLVAEQPEALLSTILSRCQQVQCRPLNDHWIAEALHRDHFLDEASAAAIAHQSQGNYNRALKLLLQETETYPFEAWFLAWLRAAYRAKGNAAVVQELLDWADTLSGIGREAQKQFLLFCIQLIRQALMANYGVKDLVYYQPVDAQFSLDKLAPFVNSANIFELVDALNDAHYHIERNGNAKIIFADLAMGMTRLIHKKEVVQA